MSDTSSVLGRGGPSPLVDAPSDASYGAGGVAVREVVNRINVSESQLITLMALVREYSSDNELYTLLAEARP